ncbi:hypothetical protein N9Y60_05760 [Crocinitomicaceae bacterium]|nr:hypothetical protein [Crocinitomicaceae bacterium]
MRFGFEVNYKYYPNTKVTPFSSFLLLNSELYYEKGTVYYTDYNSIPNEVHQVTRTWTTQIAAIQIGYGIEYRFLSQFYLTTDVSFGGYYQETDGARISDEPLLNSEWSNGFFGLSTRMGLSLGWRFKK